MLVLLWVGDRELLKTKPYSRLATACSRRQLLEPTQCRVVWTRVQRAEKQLGAEAALQRQLSPALSHSPRLCLRPSALSHSSRLCYHTRLTRAKMSTMLWPTQRWRTLQTKSKW